MKLRNKKTGEVKAVQHAKILVHFSDGTTECFHSLKELADKYIDYAEPLIKDEKIRKTVRTWAVANNIEKVEYNTYYTGGCSLVFTYGEDEELLLDFRCNIDNLVAGKKYSIDELCGEEE